MSKSPPSKESLDELRDKDLVESYQPHDLAQAHVQAMFEEAGWIVEQHGTDNRYADEPEFGDGPDLRVREHELSETKGYLEVKSKTLASNGHEWYGKLNRRHLNEYIDVEAEEDVPVYVFMCVVDEMNQMVIRHGFYRVTEAGLVGSPFKSYGNVVVEFDINDEKNMAFVEEDFSA